MGGGGGPGGGVASVQVAVYPVSCIGFLSSKLIHDFSVDEDTIKQQDSVADVTAVEVGEVETGDGLMGKY